MRSITVLYEDSAADGLVKDYGPHVLVCRCVGDRLNKELWELHQIEGVPKKGATKLRNECRRMPPQVGRDGRRVVAVYDSDRIHNDVKLPATACMTQVKEILQAECAFRDRLIVVFLERNIETVVEAVCRCTPVEEDLRRRAVDRKDRNARDIVLKKASTAEIRSCVLRAVPSLSYLVDKLCAELSGQSVAAG